VHGFNQDFQTTALDAARLSDGIKFRGDTILFSWPSKAGLLDYIYDRESATWSRDAFENMLDELIAHPAVGNIHIVAHSMGTSLTIESLRQLYTRRGEGGTSKIASVVLASPDIDLDVFSSSVLRLGNFRQRITVVIASNDRALGLLTRLGGGVTRVGAAEKPQLEAMGLRVIDASQFGGGGVNHDLFLSNAQVRRLVRSAIDEGNGGNEPVANVVMGTQ
jgi:esterase/lipase superfamily enzyme